MRTEKKKVAVSYEITFVFNFKYHLTLNKRWNFKSSFYIFHFRFASIPPLIYCTGRFPLSGVETQETIKLVTYGK